MPAVELIDDPARFAALRTDWDDLAANSDGTNPFLTWSWLNAWWTHLANGRSLAILIVRDGGQTIAIAPWFCAPGRLPWLCRYEFLGTGLAGSDYLDVLVRRGSESAAVDALRDRLTRDRSTLKLEHLPERSIAAQIAASLKPDGWTIQEGFKGVCPFVALEGLSWETYIASLEPSRRATLRRRVKALSKKFEMRFELVTGDGDREAALDRLFAFHDSRWTDRGGSTAFASPSMRMFHRDVTGRAQRDGWLRLYTLSLDGEIAGVMYGFFHRRRFYFYQHGFDSRFQQHGVGRVLLDLSIRSAIEEQAVEFDMLYGDEPYKFFWTDRTRPLARIDCYPPHFSGQLHRRTNDAEQTVRALARRVLSIHAHAS